MKLRVLAGVTGKYTMGWTRTTLQCLFLLLVTFNVQTEETKDTREELSYMDYDFDSVDDDLQKNGKRNKRSLTSLVSTCHFPFTFNGKIYNECTNDGGPGFYWCGQSYNFDMDLLWGLCTGTGTTGISDCVPSLLPGGSSAYCIIKWNDPLSRSVATTFCQVPGTFFNGYLEAYCYTPNSATTTLNAAATSTTTSTNSVLQPSHLFASSQLTQTMTSGLSTSSTTALSLAPLTSTVEVSSMTSTLTFPLPSTVDVSMMTSPSNTPLPSTVEVSCLTSTLTSPLPSTVDVTMMTSPSNTPLPSTVDVSVMTSPSNTHLPSPGDVSMMTSTLTSPLPFTVDVSTMTSSSNTHLPSPGDVSIMTSTVTSPLPSTVDVSMMTSPSNTPLPSTGDVSNMTSTLTSPLPFTIDVSFMTSTLTPPLPSTVDVSTMTSPSNTPLPSTGDVLTMTSPLNTPLPSTAGVSSMTSPLNTTTLDTSTLSITPSRAGTTSQSSPPLSNTQESVSTMSSNADSTSTVVTRLQLWMEQMSADLMSSGGLSVIESLWRYTKALSDGFQLSEVPLVLSILGNITENAKLANLQFNVDTVKKVLLIADQLMGDFSLEPSVSLEKNLGPQLLRCLDDLFSVMSITDQPFSSYFRHFGLHCYLSSCDALKDNRIMHLDSWTTVSLPSEDIDYPAGCHVNLLSMTYRPQNGSFSSQYDNKGDAMYSYYLVSDIRTNVMILNNRSFHAADINMTFTCGNRTCDHTAVCVFWDFLLNKWSSEGCLTQVTNGVTSCICHHLTSFSVLMSDSIPEDIEHSSILDCITKIGLLVSIVSLLICISIQVILLRQTRNRLTSHRHVVILHMSAFLLISNISFLISSFIDTHVQEKLCVALTFCTHLSLLGFFCWTLVQGIFLVNRLVFVFHHVTTRQFLALSIMLGYVCPLVVAGGTFLVYFPHNYRRNDACWLESSSGASLSFNIPTIVIMSGNVLVLVVVIRKVLRPSISEGQSEDEEVVRKLAKAVLFCTPQFGLTWAVGIPLFTIQHALCLHYMFDLLNPLQGVFLLLFGCLLDKRVMHLVKEHFLKKSALSSMATAVSTNG